LSVNILRVPNLKLPFERIAYLKDPAVSK
jgi:hypothetical protein